MSFKFKHTPIRAVPENYHGAQPFFPPIELFSSARRTTLFPRHSAGQNWEIYLSLMDVMRWTTDLFSTHKKSSLEGGGSTIAPLLQFCSNEKESSFLYGPTVGCIWSQVCSEDGGYFINNFSCWLGDNKALSQKCFPYALVLWYQAARDFFLFRKTASKICKTWYGVEERDRQTDRQRQTDRERDRQTDRQTDRDTERDRETDRKRVWPEQG